MTLVMPRSVSGGLITPLVAVALSLVNPALAEKPRENRHGVARDLHTWDTDRFSRPQGGTARDYVYLVTAMGIKRLQEYNATRGDLSGSKLVFASLIADRDSQRWTIGKAGLILSAKPENVAGNYHFDTAWYLNRSQRSYMSMQDVVKMISQQYPPKNGGGIHQAQLPRPADQPHVILSPRELLKQTSHGWNEVLLVGRPLPAGYGLTASGVFIRTARDNGRDLANPEEVKAFTAAAEEWKLPLVRIPE